MKAKIPPRRIVASSAGPSLLARSVRTAMAAVVPLALVIACASSQPETTGAGSGPTASSDFCASPHENCPCSRVGDVAECGKAEFTSGLYTTCLLGNITCNGERWGSCETTTTGAVIQSTAPIGPGSLNLLLGGPGCNPCDLYCVGSPTMSNIPDGGSVDGAATLPEGGITVLPTIPGNDGGSCGPGCSSDLHRVLNCDGTVQTVCNSNSGCDPVTKTCVPACQAALANQSNRGCEFLTVEVDSPVDSGWAIGSCYALQIANAWNAPVTFTASFNGATLNPANFTNIPTGSGTSITYAPLPSTGLPAGQIGIMFLSGDPLAPAVRCPPGVNVAYPIDRAPHATGISGSAFRVNASAPVVAYDVFPYGGGSSYVTSASLILPTSSWGNDYVAMQGYRAIPGYTSPGTWPYMDVIASENNTTINLTIANNPLVGNGPIAAVPVGGTGTYTLQAGEVFHIAQFNELSGSIVNSNKPIAVVAGHQCAFVPTGVPYCDSLHQQIPPTRALGTEYAAVRYRNRGGKQCDTNANCTGAGNSCVDGVCRFMPCTVQSNCNGQWTWGGNCTGGICVDLGATATETPPWRIVGAADGTVLTYDPAVPPGAPTTLAKGQVVEFNAAGPFVVKSQGSNHPFYMALYMSGGAAHTVGPWMYAGDSDFVNVIPGAQYLTNYTFFVDPTYPDASLVVTRARDASNLFQPVTIDCMGAIPAAQWIDVGTNGRYQYARVQLVDIPYLNHGACAAGSRTASSAGPFGITVWEWGQGSATWCTSSAYPAGAAVRSANTLIAPTAPSFGSTGYVSLPFNTSCPSHKRAMWRLFQYQANVPAGTSIKFYAKTSRTQTGLASAQQVLFATQTTSTTGWVAADVESALQAAGSASRPYLEIVVELVTSSSAAPTLLTWQQQLNCLEDQ